MEESESQRQLKRQCDCERRQVESERQSRQQKEQRQAHQQQKQEQRAQEHREEQLNRYYEEQAATQSAKRRKATEARVRVAEKDSKAQGARGERSLETPKNNLIQSTPAFVKLSKYSVIQSKLASQIVTTIHTKKKQPMSDDEGTDKYDVIPERIRDTGKKNYSTRTAKDNKKRKKKVKCASIETSGKSRKRSKDPGKYGTEFGMQMNVDRFGDGWHKSIGKSFGIQHIAALFGDAVT